MVRHRFLVPTDKGSNPFTPEDACRPKDELRRTPGGANPHSHTKDTSKEKLSEFWTPQAPNRRWEPRKIELPDAVPPSLGDARQSPNRGDPLGPANPANGGASAPYGESSIGPGVSKEVHGGELANSQIPVPSCCTNPLAKAPKEPFARSSLHTETPIRGVPGPHCTKEYGGFPKMTKRAKDEEHEPHCAKDPLLPPPKGRLGDEYSSGNCEGHEGLKAAREREETSVTRAKHPFFFGSSTKTPGTNPTQSGSRSVQEVFSDRSKMFPAFG